MKSIAFKFAASSVALSMAVVGCQSDGFGFGASSAFASQAQGGGQASQLHRDAGQALARGDLARALEAMEQAVALSPRDAGYRLLLADIYMRSGRFASAETTYRDVLEIDPSQSRAAIALALMQAASGRPQDALAQLDSVQGQASPSDLGLAYALAGSPQRAVEILEPAARSMSATARVRQNLALAYALGGDWSRARMIASQDVSPAELSQRMSEWASLTSNSVNSNPVVAVLGVNPVTDAGQPVRLALNAPAAPMSAPIQMAEAAPIVLPAPEPAEPAVVPVPAASPVAAPAYAEHEQPEWGNDSNGAVQLPATDPEDSQLPARVQYAAATDALVRPDPAVMPVSQRPIRRSGRIVDAAPTPSVTAPERSGTARYVVQIGAFSSAANAERAWQDAERRFGLSSEQPVTMTFDHNGRLFHRVAVSGFASRADAGRLCTSIRTRGGECFVRGNAGDAVIRWASRYGRRA